MDDCSNFDGASYSFECLDASDTAGLSPETFVYKKRHFLLNIMDVFLLKGRFI